MQATKCIGCQKNIFEETSLAVYAAGTRVGHVCNIVQTEHGNRNVPICIRRAFWFLKGRNAGITAIMVRDRLYNSLDCGKDEVSTRRPSGSRVSAVPYAMAQKSVPNHTYHPPRSYHS